MISLISWLITGLVIGLIARALMPGKQPLGILLTTGLGIAGAMIGGLISSAIWPTWGNDPNVSQMWPGWLMSIFGAVLLLGLSLMLASKRAVA